MGIASFKGKEFFRVGYYVYNNISELESAEGATVDVTQIDIRKVQRSILADKPKIIHKPIDWEEQEKEMVLLSEMMGGIQTEPTKNFLSFSDNSINFSGVFNNSGKSDSNNLFAKPTQTTFEMSSPFTSFGGGSSLFGNNGSMNNGGSILNNGGSMLNNGGSMNSGAPTLNTGGDMMSMNNQNGFSLLSNNTTQFQTNQQPFMNQPFGTMGIQQQMLPQQQQPTGYFDLQNNGMNGGIGQFNQQQQPITGMGGSLFGQNFQ